MDDVVKRGIRHPDALDRMCCRLVVVDLQERLLPHIESFPAVLAGCQFLIEAARLVGVPIEVSEQYPKGLGRTVSPLRELLPAAKEKSRFSAAEAFGGGLASARADGRFQVVLIGIETHICVLQTALDLVAAGYQVFIPVDAVGSRFAIDRDVALRRMEAAGVMLTTAESAAFEWCETAAAEPFKALSQLVKQRVRG